MTTVLGPSTPTPIFEALNKANDLCIDRAVFNLEMSAKTEKLSPEQYQVYMGRITGIVHGIFNQIDQLHRTSGNGDQILELADRQIEILYQSRNIFRE